MCVVAVLSACVSVLCLFTVECSLSPFQLPALSVKFTASRTTQEVRSPASGSEVRGYNTQRHVCLTTPHVLYSGHSVSLTQCAWPPLGVYCKVNFIVKIYIFYIVNI